MWPIDGGAENASTGKRKYGKGKCENSAFRKDGKRMYGKRKYSANLQSDKKSLVLHKLVWCIFKWGAQVDYRLVFLR